MFVIFYVSVYFNYSKKKKRERHENREKSAASFSLLLNTTIKCACQDVVQRRQREGFQLRFPARWFALTEQRAHWLAGGAGPRPPLPGCERPLSGLNQGHLRWGVRRSLSLTRPLFPHPSLRSLRSSFPWVPATGARCQVVCRPGTGQGSHTTWASDSGPSPHHSGPQPSPL